MFGYRIVVRGIDEATADTVTDGSWRGKANPDRPALVLVTGEDLAEADLVMVDLSLERVRHRDGIVWQDVDVADDVADAYANIAYSCAQALDLEHAQV